MGEKNQVTEKRQKELKKFIEEPFATTAILAKMASELIYHTALHSDPQTVGGDILGDKRQV